MGHRSLEIVAAVALVASSGCGSDDRRSDAGPGDGGVAHDAEVDAPASVSDSGRAGDGAMGGLDEGGIDLEGGRPAPEGRVRCYFGANYNCTREGEACCMSEDICYFPDEEPEVCPDG